MTVVGAEEEFHPRFLRWVQARGCWCRILKCKLARAIRSGGRGAGRRQYMRNRFGRSRGRVLRVVLLGAQQAVTREVRSAIDSWVKEW